MKDAKSIEPSVALLNQAYQRVKSGREGAKIDPRTLEIFERKLQDHLYQIWNRLRSGSYFPHTLASLSGLGQKPMGIAQLGDAVAQMLILLCVGTPMEREIQQATPLAQRNSLAGQALQRLTERCARLDWIVQFDLRGLLGQLDARLLSEILEREISCPWASLYIQRCLNARAHSLAVEQRPNGILLAAGSPILPILENRFLQVAFDQWMFRNHARIAFERYDKEIILHCDSQQQAEFIQGSIQERFVHIQLNHWKTRRVQSWGRNSSSEQRASEFDFLGYTFRPRKLMNAQGKVSLDFSPAIGQLAKLKIWAIIRSWNRQYWQQLSLAEIAEQINPIIRRWIRQYGRYNPRVLQELLQQINRKLAAWIRYRFKGLKRSKRRAAQRLGEIYLQQPQLFAHWAYGVKPRVRLPRPKPAID